jgi:membrane peptidoglycan carboxypeptidase
MRQALTQSKNVPTVRLANEVGMGRVLGVAEQFGLGRMPSNPSVVLGTAEVTPVRLTAAYAAFATLGRSRSRATSPACWIATAASSGSRCRNGRTASSTRPPRS